MKNLLAVLCGALLLGCVSTSKSNRPLVEMQDAPEFTLQRVGGGEVKSADLKGKVVVINFWATWCPPCKIEIPHFNEMRARLKDKGVEFIGVTYESGTAVSVRPFLEDLKMEYPVVMGTDELDAALGGHIGLPTTFLVGKDWKVYRKILGAVLNYEIFENDLTALLSQ